MFRLKTLGSILIEGPNGVLTGAASQRRRLALLALVAAGRGGISRDRLVGLLWPESDEERARHALSQLLYALRRDLGADVVSGGTTALTLDSSVLSSDVGDLHHAFDAGHFDEVAELYAGPFLDGFYLNGCPDFERWVDEERARVASRVHVALDKLATRARQSGDVTDAVRWLKRLAALAPLDSRIARSLVEALAAAGDRSGALRQARIHQELLRVELGTAPDPALAALVTTLEGSAPALPHPAGTAASGGVSRSSLPLDPPPSTAASAEIARPAAGSRPDGSRAAGASIPIEPHQSSRGARVRRRRVPIRALAAAGIVLLATAAVLGTRLVRAPVTPRDLVVIADAENATGDSVFDRSLPVALAAALAQSRRVYVLPPQRVRQAFERMRRPEAALGSLGAGLAREVAQREGARVVVVPTIVRVDSAYEIGARLEDAATGGVLSAITVRAARRGDVVDALDRVGRRLRRALGESMLSVATRTIPLPLVTTRSIDALKKYADGSLAFRTSRLDEARALLTDAVTIDSTFASALAALGTYYYWTNQPAAGDRYFSRALAHLDALPDREQVMIRARSESWRGNRQASTTRLEAYLVGHPDDLDVLDELGYAFMRMGRSADAARTLQRVVALDSLDYNAFINLATAERQLGRFRDAVAHYHRAFGLMPSMESANTNLNLEYGSAYVELGEPDSAAAVFAAMLEGDRLTRARGLRSLAFLDMSRGQYSRAPARLAEAIGLTSEALLSQVRNRLLLAAALDRLGRERDAAAQLDSSYVSVRRFDAEPTFLFWVGKSLARAGRARQADALLETLRTRVHNGSTTDSAAREGLVGEVLVAQRRAKDAVPHLEAAFRADSSAFTLESLAYGVAASGALERADSLYRELAKHREFGWEGQEYWHMALYQVGRTDELLGRADAAVAAYQQFLDLWRGAEPLFPPLVDARERMARLHQRDVPR